METASPALDYVTARFNMVESQIRPNKVRNEPLLDSMRAIPRELFVPTPLSGIAYIDEDLPLGGGRYLLEPMILARLIEAARVKSSDRVLDVAPATGYSTAVLASLAREVIAVEAVPTFIQQAVANFTQLKLDNVSMQLGPLYEGWSAAAPYDVILVNGAADRLPDSLSSQLAEGGRLLIVIRQFGTAHAAHTMEARLYEKLYGALSYRSLFDANVKVLPGFEAKPNFSF